MAEKGIPGLAVAVAAAGLLYFWAGYKGASVTDTLKSLLKGEQPSGEKVNPITLVSGGTTSSDGTGVLSSNAVVAFAQKQIGIQYQFGGGDGTHPTVGTNSARNGKPGWDCSGLTQAAWNVGTNGKVHLGHYVPAQYAETKRVAKNALQPADIVFFHGDGNLAHCGLYIGNDQFIEAAHTGTNVRVSKLSTRGDYVGGGRPPGY